MFTRRQLLTGAAAAAGAAALPAVPTASTASAGRSAGPFALGVASGDPLPDGVVLWTRLIADAGGRAGAWYRRPVEVGWQIARDERFRRVVRTGRTAARPELAHSVHVDARGLEPGRDYFYRFRALGELSPVGRTRTAPHRRHQLAALSLGIVNCQDLQNGYWPAYWGLAEEDLDVVLHLGDYIYEYDPSSRFPDRR